MIKSSRERKLRPAYYSELLNYPKADPVFIAVNWPCLNYIRNRHGVCVLCDKNCELYDLRFCNHKEAWVMYSDIGELIKAERLANAIIRHGASKVRIVPVNIEERLYA